MKRSSYWKESSWLKNTVVKIWKGQVTEKNLVDLKTLLLKFEKVKLLKQFSWLKNTVVKIWKGQVTEQNLVDGKTLLANI